MDEYLSYFAELAVLQKRENPDHSRLDERRTVLIILLASYAEAVINLYFAFAFDAATLKKFDRKSILTKWSKSPAQRVPNYTLDTQLYDALKELVDCRHAIAHMQPEFSQGDVAHRGNYGPLEAVNHERIMRWARLPLELVDNIRAQDKSVAGDSLSSTSDVWAACQGWDDRLKFYRDKFSAWNGPWRFTRL